MHGEQCDEVPEECCLLPRNDVLAGELLGVNV